MANLQPVISPKSADKRDILNLLAALHDEGHRITFTWCPSHCRVVGNETTKPEEELQPIKMFDTTTLYEGHHQACYQRERNHS